MQSKDDQNDALSSEYLQYGSEISFSYQDIGYITSSGFIDNLLYLKSEATLDYSQCLFRVFPFCIHSIQNNLHQRVRGPKAESISEYSESYQKINDSLEGEIRSNLVNYEKIRGKYVRFGSLVYFQHVASHKFLSVIPKETGLIEKYSVKVALTDFPDDYSYIKIEPSYNFQREGEGLIRTNDIVQLVVFLAEMHKSAYINASTKDHKEFNEIPAAEGREINASLDNKMKWRINLYSFTPRDKQKLLNYGDCIWISHSEGGVIFTTLKTDENLFMYFNSNFTDSNGLWRIERAEMSGGYVYTNEEFLLKHLTTGLYLSLEKDETRDKSTGTLKPRNEACSWKFVSIYDWEKNVKIEIDHFFYLIHAAEDVKLQGVEDNEHIAFIRLDFTKDTSEAAFFKIFKADSTFLWETQFTINSYETISNFSKSISELTSKYEDRGAVKRSSGVINHCLEQMGDFLQHKLCSSFSTGKNYGQIDASRQKIFKEIQIIDVLSSLLDHLFTGEFNLAKVQDSEKGSINENFNSVMTCLKETAKHAYKVLGITCQENNSNQIYAFKFFSIYQKHGGYELGATNCMKSVLMNNESLMSCLEEGSIAVQLGRAGVSVIEHYIWLLRKFFRDRKPHLIEFLSDICGCADIGIAINQNSIHEKLFLNPQTYNKGIIATSIDSDNKTLFVVFQNKAGLGEQNIALVECFEKEGQVKESLQKEIFYFVNMLQLFANLCKGRNTACKASISKWFPIDVLMANIWNHELSTEIRAAFLQMMVNMHIDASPRVAVKKPELIRTFRSKKELDDIILMRHSVKDLNNSLSNFKKKKKTIMIRKDDPAPNILMEEANFGENTQKIVNSPIFKFAKRLIKFIKNIQVPRFDILLLQMLKSVNLLINFEVISSEVQHYVKDREMDIISLLKGANFILFYNIDKEIQKEKNNKKQMQDFHDKAKNKGKQLKTNADDPFRRFSEGLRHYLRYHTLRSTDDSEVENTEIKCKLELCDMLFHAIDLRQDFLISNVIKWFEFGDSPEPADDNDNDENSENQEDLKYFDYQKLIPPLIRTDDKEAKNSFEVFHSPSIEHLTLIIPDIFENLLHLFTTTKNYKFQTKILGILLRMFSQRKEMIKNLRKITFMIHPSDGDFYMKTKEWLSSFKYFSDQALVICSFWKQREGSFKINQGNLNQCLEILKNIKKMVSVKDSVVSNERQGMLRYLNFHTYAIKFISQGFPIFEDIFDNPKNDKEINASEILSNVFKKCFKALTIFIKNNRKNQILLYESLEILMRTFRIKLGQIDLICEIFNKNIELCNKIDERLISLFKELILHEGRRPEFLKFYDTVVMIDKEPIAHLQRLILSALTNKSDSESLLFMKNGKFDFDSDLIGNAEKDSPGSYHAILIRVLAKCGLAAYGFKLSRIKCQKIITLDYFYALFFQNSPPNFNNVRLSLLDFLLHIYLNKDSFIDATLNQNFLNLIINCLKNLNESKKISASTEPWVEKLVLIFHQYNLLLLDEFKPEVQDHDHLNDKLEKFYSDERRIMLKVQHQIKLYLEILMKLLEEDNQITKPFFKELDFLLDFYKIEKLSAPLENSVLSNSSTAVKDRWSKLIKCLSSPKFSKLVKEETQCFLKKFSEIESSGLTKNLVLQGLLEYISLSSIHRPPTHIVCSVIEFLGFNLSEDGGSEEKTAELKQATQNAFREMNVVHIIMKLMCDVHIDAEIFAILIEFSTKLLDGGNEKIQQDFYDYFLVKSSSEHFFAALYTRLWDFTSKIGVISDVERNSSKYFKKSRKIISNIIKLMQLFCENHYETLQNYLRNQEKSRNNYDLIGAVILLLRELMVKKRMEYFHIMSNCFELLTECIQGPCRLNQKAIINSKFLEIVSELLSIDENSKTIQPYEGLNMIYEVSGSRLLLGWMVSHLKYKCLITLIALLEGRTDHYVITRMFRAFNLLLFKKNMISIHSLYLKQFTGAEYNESLFERFSGNEKYKEGHGFPQDLEPEKYTMIIEIGFMVFQLISYFTEIDDPDIKKVMMNDFPDLYTEDTSYGFNFLPFEMIGKGLMSAAKILGKQENISEETALKQAVLFFKRKTGDIEIVFKGTINKMYFWLPPVCDFLTSDTKKEFHDQADRSSEKAKIEYLVTRFPQIRDDMQYEQSLSKVYGYRFLSSRIAFFKVILFLLTLYLNCLLLFSYNDYEGGRLDEPELGYIQMTTSSKDITSSSETISHIYAVGIVHCILSCLIFLYFTIKTIPLIIKTELREMQNSSETPNFIKILRVGRKMIVKVDVIYQFGFFTFSIFGLAWHPFFFSIHLLDILYRIPSLQNVIMAVVLPWKSLVLVFFLVVIINYLFSIWAYVDFHEQFANNCESLLLCFRTIFDQGYKNSGGIGMWLDYISLWYRYEGAVFKKKDVIPRYFFDDLYMIIIPILMANIIYGLILDTFSVLKETEDESWADKENKCFICGKAREDIERLTSKPFLYHVSKEHCEWNYIFFIAYLAFKKPTEYSGIESYINAQVESNEVDWIPQQQGLSFKIEVKDEETSNFLQIKEINQSISKFDQEIKKLKKTSKLELATRAKPA